MLDTLVFQVGLSFALRSGREHRELTPAQLVLRTVQGKQVLVYTEKNSKSYQGGLKHRRIEPKCVSAFETNDELCLVKLHQLYLQKCPPNRLSTAYYLQPKQSKPQGVVDWAKTSVWFNNVPVGFNTLASTIKRLCKEAGFEEHFTNHSLRATAATRLFQADVDEQLICETTGHRSTAVRSYKRTNDHLKEKLSHIVQGVMSSAKASSGPSHTVNLHVKGISNKAGVEGEGEDESEKVKLTLKKGACASEERGVVKGDEGEIEQKKESESSSKVVNIVINL